nr:MAG: transposase [Leptolyngbya sp. IPPAS B-1204]
MKPYSLDLREKIISTYEAGNTSIRQVAARFQVSKNTVQSLLKRKQATGTLKPAPATGGKTSQLAGFEQEIAEMVEQHQDYTLAEYCESWQEKTGVRVSESTMCRFLQNSS